MCPQGSRDHGAFHSSHPFLFFHMGAASSGLSCSLFPHGCRVVRIKLLRLHSRCKCLKINFVIKSAASADSPTTKMQGSPSCPLSTPNRHLRASLHFGCWVGCASSRVDHTVDLQASRTKYGSANGPKSDFSGWFRCEIRESGARKNRV